MNSHPNERLINRCATFIKSLVQQRPLLRDCLLRLRNLGLRLRHTALVLLTRGNQEWVQESMPLILGFPRGSCSIDLELKATYREYTRQISSDGMAISYELACFLWSLCEATEPQRILDLGSGFSSFVFRRYQKAARMSTEVWSVDENAVWLEKTRDFLGAHGLSYDNLYTWDDFSKLRPGTFDLISHDLGLMEDRPEIFEDTLAWREPAGLIVIDDIHKPQYRKGIIQKLQRHNEIRRLRPSSPHPGQTPEIRNAGWGKMSG